MSEVEALVKFRLAPLCTRRDIAMLGVIHRSVLGRGPPHFAKYIRLAERPHRGTRQSEHAHRMQVCSIIDGTQKAIARRSLLGLLDVYNLLPASVVERSASVQCFQKVLQELVTECAAAGTDGWQRLLSPRQEIYCHPLRAWRQWESHA